MAGHMTEYSSMKFAWFFLAEYINMFNVSAIATTLFLGGWRAPWPISAINDGMFNEGWWPFLWFFIKMWLVMFFFIWVRGTLLRFRYDQFMNIGWKILIPVALGWLVAVAGVQALRAWADIDLRTMLIWIGLPLVAIVALIAFWPSKKEPEPVAAGPKEFDPLADGFPVPPMPGQVLPPAPRRRTVSATIVSSSTTPETDPSPSSTPSGKEASDG